MELALSSSVTSTTFFVSRLHRHIHTKPHLKSQLTHLISKSKYLNSTSTYFAVKSPPIRFQARCFVVFGHGGGDGGGGGGFGGGGGDGRSSRGESKVNAVVDDGSALLPDVIILDVEGMTCGGCAASVKRILENQPQVSSASVNLTTETAVIWPISEAKTVPNWQKELGEALAKHLTTCGFKSKLRGEGAIEGDIPS